MIEPNGTVVSRAGAAEFYRIQLAVPDGPVTEVAFEKAPGQRVTLMLESADSVVAVQVGKPKAVFARLGSGKAGTTVS